MIGSFIAADLTTGVPTVTGAPGIWSPKQIFDYRRQGVWPLAQNAAVRPTDKGFIVSGVQSGGTYPGRTDSQRWTYSTETVTDLTMGISPGLCLTASYCTNNTGTAGYCCGGYNSNSTYNNSSKCAYATETISTLSNLPYSARYGAAGVSAQLKGYVGGGLVSSTVVKDLCTLTMSTDTFATAIFEFTSADFHYPGCPIRNQYKACFIGGSSISATTNKCNRLNFATETMSQMADFLTSVQNGNGMTKNEAYPANMYLLGGESNQSTYKATFAAETWSLISATGMTDTAKGWGHRFGGTDAGYVMEGSLGTGGTTKFLFATEIGASASVGTVRALGFAFNLGGG